MPAYARSRDGFPLDCGRVLGAGSTLTRSAGGALHAASTRRAQRLAFDKAEASESQAVTMVCHGRLAPLARWRPKIIAAPPTYRSPRSPVVARPVRGGRWGRVVADRGGTGAVRRALARDACSICAFRSRSSSTAFCGLLRPENDLGARTNEAK
jgi:hypothetical protein